MLNGIARATRESAGLKIMAESSSVPESTLEIGSCVRGYHVYMATWTPVLGEEVSCIREMNNVKDRHSVAVVKNGSVVGRLPRKISLLCSLFIRKGGSIVCKIIGSREHSQDLPQGGLQIPCTILFTGSIENIKKLHRLKNI